MKKIIFLCLTFLLCICAGSIQKIRQQKFEIERLQQNQTALHQTIRHTRSKLGVEVASCDILRLRLKEFKQQHEKDKRLIKRLGIKVRRLEMKSLTATSTSMNFTTPLHDSILLPTHQSDLLSHRDTDTIRTFLWHDSWVSIRGFLHRDSVHCHLQSIDTLHQIVHRIPRRFLFFRWGTKAIRQEIFSSNPHTKIVYSRIIKIEKRKRRR